MSKDPFDNLDIDWEEPKITLGNKLYNFYLSIKYKILNKVHHIVAHKLHMNVCQNNVCFKFGRWERQNTAYTDEESNWVFLCDECHKYNDEYWADMWSNYWSSRL